MIEGFRRSAEEPEGTGQELSLEIKKLEYLDRIAQALEDISGHLEALEDTLTEFDACISRTDHGSYICITGNMDISTY